MYRGVTWILGVRLCESASRQVQAASSFRRGLGAAREGELLCLLIQGRVTSSAFAEIASETLDAKASPCFFFQELFLTTILLSVCFLGLLLFFLQKGYWDLRNKTNKQKPP